MKNLNISSEYECESSVLYSLEEALALMQQVRLSKYQYNTIHSPIKGRKTNIYPGYHSLLEIEKDCHPFDIL